MSSSFELSPNNVLLARRLAEGWGRGRLAFEMECIAARRGLSVPERTSLEKAIYRHEKGISQPTDELYITLYCEAFKASRRELFGELEAGNTISAINVSVHRFMPVFVGCESVSKVMADLGATEEECEWSSFYRVQIDHPHGDCHLYGFPWGILLYHLDERITAQSLGDLALKRRESRIRETQWTSNHGSQIGHKHGGAEYVLSTYWVNESAWPDSQLETAMRILAMPRVLLDQSTGEPDLDHAQLVERNLLENGFDDSAIAGFGVRGISHGYASWAGVSYFPMAPERAVSSEYLVRLQAVVQALWCYCHDLRKQVEAGQDPTVPDGFGWRWLRGMRSRLAGARPTESAQLVSMRSAILETSQLAGNMSEIVDVLRETEQR